MKTTHICVGGPLSGKRYTIMYGRRFHIALRPKVDLPDLINMAQYSDDPVETKYIEYEEQYFCHTSGRVIFWAPVGQSPTESLRLLLETYEAHHAPTPQAPRARTPT